jgi:hypothetical protein
MPAGYSKRSLVQKLGIKPHSRVAILHAPDAFSATLGPLPEGVRPLRNLAKDLDLLHAFFKDSRTLDREFPSLKKSIKQNGAVWISWPKKEAKVPTDLTGDIVRTIGLKHGLVDVKVCAVDEIWSGLKFMYRLKDRG